MILKLAFGENPTIKTVGLNNQLDITTSYLIDDPRHRMLILLLKDNYIMV